MKSNMEKLDDFNAVVLGIIYDPAKKKILVGKREKDPYIPNLTWCFPGGRLNTGEEIDKSLKAHIKKKTGYDVMNLGSVFSKIMNERPNTIVIYFLTEVYKGKEKAGDGMKELRWVDPEELETLFQTSFNPRLKEYLINLK